MPQEIIRTQQIADKILVLRGQKILLDRELAALYGVQTRVLNQAVKRNAARFSEDFMFSLKRDEIVRVSQPVTFSGNLRFPKSVHAFTEQGVAMRSSVLRSERAVQMKIARMRAFVQLRFALESNRELVRKFVALEERVGKHDEDIAAVIEANRYLVTPEKEPRREIGFHVRETAPRYGGRKKR